MLKVAYAALALGVINISVVLWRSDDINTTLKVLALLQIIQILLPWQYIRDILDSPQNLKNYKN